MHSQLMRRTQTFPIQEENSRLEKVREGWAQQDLICNDWFVIKFVIASTLDYPVVTISQLTNGQKISIIFQG